MLSPPRFYVSVLNFDSSFVLLHVFGVRIDILGWRIACVACKDVVVCVCQTCSCVPLPVP
ncbi:hypothetical protein M6B38_356235 [Iris pallida]|uniref:Uncharacterized protein n=1 Tax=Iris pallida TaxID=29817 RepID=A0AAX6GM28_IRIPA|nr:hypothetical protein M6B38_356235 [Iris pallida]